MTNCLQATLSQIMNDGQRPLVTLRKLDEQIVSKSLINRLNALANPESVQFFPSVFDRQVYREPRLLNAGATPLPKERSIGPNQRTIGNCKIQDLGSTTRIITASRSANVEFEAFLQILSERGWITIVCYEYRNGRARRKMYYENGQYRLLLVDLPQSIVLEMAQEDFKRNWTAYYEEFQKDSPGSRVKVAFPA